MARSDPPVALPWDGSVATAVLIADTSVARDLGPQSGRIKLQVSPRARWRAELTLPLMDRAAGGARFGTLAELQGERRLLIGDVFGRAPRQAFAGSLFARETLPARQPSVILTGFRDWPADGSTFLPGDYLEIQIAGQHRLHRVTDPALIAGTESDPDVGYAQVRIWPPLRDELPKGHAVGYRNCRGQFLLRSTPGWAADAAGNRGLEPLRAVEWI